MAAPICNTNQEPIPWAKADDRESMSLPSPPPPPYSSLATGTLANVGRTIPGDATYSTGAKHRRTQSDTSGYTSYPIRSSSKVIPLDNQATGPQITPDNAPYPIRYSSLKSGQGSAQGDMSLASQPATAVPQNYPLLQPQSTLYKAATGQYDAASKGSVFPLANTNVRMAPPGPSSSSKRAVGKGKVATAQNRPVPQPQSTVYKAATGQSEEASKGSVYSLARTNVRTTPPGPSSSSKRAVGKGKVAITNEFEDRERSPEFFKVGKTFCTIWFEPTHSRPAATTSYLHDGHWGVTPNGQSYYRKRRYFIVIRESQRHCIALGIWSHQNEGLRGVPYDERWQYGVVYTGKQAVILAQDELPPEEYRQPQPQSIRVLPDRNVDSLLPMSRLNYARLYTIEFNVPVQPFGVVHPAHVDILISQFRDAFNIITNPIQARRVAAIASTSAQTSTQTRAQFPTQTRAQVPTQTGAQSLTQPRIQATGPPPVQQPQVMTWEALSTRLYNGIAAEMQGVQESEIQQAAFRRAVRLIRDGRVVVHDLPDHVRNII